VPYTKSGDKINEAARALSDLNIFAAVQVLMESSLVSPNCRAAEARIVQICRTEQAKCLKRYDRLVKEAGGGTYGL
jgi:hypothetical protein